MNKLLLISVFALLLISLVSAREGNCNPEPGYTKCYFNEKTYDYMSCHAKAFSKTQITDPIEVENGRKVGVYVTGRAYIRYKFDGDYFCFFENKKWSEVWKSYKCSRSGCVFNCDKKLNKFGKYYLTQKPGDEYQASPIFATIDFDLDETSECWSWAAAGSGYGWQTPNKILVRQVECYDNSDCSYGYYCNKSGDWKSWSCKRAECIDGQTKCEGYEYYECENYKWSKKGKVLGKCSIECLKDSDCKADEFIGDRFCYNETAVGQLYRDYYCDSGFKIGIFGATSTKAERKGDYKCKFVDVNKSVEICDYKCKGGKCVSRSSYIVLYSIIAGVVVVFGAVIYFLIKFVKKIK